MLNQRSIALTAQYWNPILTHVSKKSGVPLELKLAKTAQEGNAIAEKYGYDFLYTNHFFTPERDRLGYKVIARPAGPGIRSQIVVPEDSPIQTLQDLSGKDVAFVSPDAFAGYWLPMDALLQGQGEINVVFTGNQEASSAQLRVNKVAAAGVNSSVLARYARRESFQYRALWTSEIYQDLCIMASPKVPADKVAAVRAALHQHGQGPGRPPGARGRRRPAEKHRRPRVRRGGEPGLRQLPQVLPDHAGQVVGAHGEAGRRR